MEKVAGSQTSVYVGCFSTDWQHLSFRDGEECGTTAALGATLSLNANRISWFFDFLGNSANIDSACSSSLVCLDLGCQGLRSGAEDMVSYRDRVRSIRYRLPESLLTRPEYRCWLQHHALSRPNPLAHKFEYVVRKRRKL
jgi:hypothetical protein